jgi:hypothetical protein
MRNGRIEDAITMWLAESFPNAESQVNDIYSTRPDIVFAYEQDELGDDPFVFLEAKPIWQRWITTGERAYAGAVVDHLGRGTGSYCSNNVRQLISDRNKLLRVYTDPRDRHLLLALVFQRPGEVDARVIASIGSGWDHVSRYIADLCNPAGDNIGMTAMLFWPQRGDVTSAAGDAK